VTAQEFAKYIDHTLLRPDATKSEIAELCQQALDFGFYAVCVNPIWVAFARKQLENAAVRIAAVVGFPLGSNLTSVKAYEAERAIADGAAELDMVIDVGKLKSGDAEFVLRDIEAVVTAANPNKEDEPRPIVKAILETTFLTEREKIRAAQIAEEAGAKFVKTSTGFAEKEPRGATLHDVELLRRTCSQSVGVKASGGIRSFAFAMELIGAGANRLGTSRSVELMREGFPLTVTGKR
jgi:deoxyribose-phosphate aldolase